MSETATGAYKALFTCASTGKDEDGDCLHDGPCEWTWTCDGCGRDVSAKPCAEHAPADVPGLRRIDCERGHGPTWVLDDDGYEPPCPWCARDDEADAHEGCEHSHHGRWRRWKITHRVLARLYVLGAASSGTRWGGGCDYCAVSVRWGRNTYLLGWPRWKWRCLLVARHWPGEEFAYGLCCKCSPWPCCGSRVPAHADGCPEAMS
jgi:hypothetical protein